MTKLFLTRHGETQWNLLKKIQGSKNSDLTEKGKMQALQLGKYLEKTDIDIIYTSSSKRAYDTANIIAQNREIEIIVSDALKEMDMGIWEGKTFHEVRKQYPQMYELYWNKPHQIKEFPGETFEDLFERVLSEIFNIVENNIGKNILIVSHALVLKAAMSYFEKRPLEKLFDDHHMYSTCINEVHYNNNEYKIIKYNTIEHYNIEIN